jgi:hypothetical protein
MLLLVVGLLTNHEQKMAAKTTSATVIAGKYTYIFTNRPNTSHIDIVRFIAGSEEQGRKQGKISVGSNEVFAKEGPIGALTYWTGDVKAPHIRHIVLYYFGTKDGTTEIYEIKLDNASEEGTDPIKSWRSEGSDITFRASIDREVDSTSLLAATSRENRPTVVFTTKGKPNTIWYAFYDEKAVWRTSQLPIPV